MLIIIKYTLHKELITNKLHERTNNLKKKKLNFYKSQSYYFKKGPQHLILLKN